MVITQFLLFFYIPPPYYLIHDKGGIHEWSYSGEQAKGKNYLGSRGMTRRVKGFCFIEIPSYQRWEMV